MKAVDFDSEARDEFRAAAAYYEAQTAGLGHDFAVEVEQASQRIAQMPQAFAAHDLSSGVRKCVLRRFPYNIFFLWNSTIESGSPQSPINVAGPGIGLTVSPD